MPRCRVKICGITSVADAQLVAAAGADALGLVFYPPSPRHVSLAQAAAIAASLPPFISVVGLFLDADAEFVQAALEQVRLDVLQWHGSEPAAYCRQFNKPYLKGVGMQGLSDAAAFTRYADQYPDAQAFLVDSHAPGAAGGTGQCFDWTQVPQHYARPLILAGGLNPTNVASAIQSTRVYAVDVSSGVESQPGIKDAAKVHAFVQAANRA